MPLTVLVDSAVAHSIVPRDAPVVIGREEPAQIRIPDSRISRQHLTLTVRGDQWVATDAGSTNGTFVDGEQIREYVIPDEGVTMNLGHPVGGIVVTFTTQDAGIVFAGAAVNKQRVKMGISQRKLADQKVINAGALISFEKGRSWPRVGTQHALEEVLGWPRGEISRLRSNFNSGGTTTTVAALPARPEPDPEKTVLLPAKETTGSHVVEPSVLAQFAAMTLSQAKAHRAGLPAVSNRKYATEVDRLISSLSGLETLLHTASSAPELRSVFLQVRKELREVMLEAATSPHATAGQKLFAARDQARLSVDDAAAMAGVPAASVIAFEAGGPLVDEHRVLLQNFLASLQ
jgi:DNA-binding XRE family transcriptional regulator